MHIFNFTATSLEDTDRLGAVLARELPPMATVALHGTLGAGKTRLVQAIAQHCGVPPDRVTSPTFVLCQHYAGNRTLNHLDAYRIGDLDEFLELGVEEYFESAGITLIEWAEKIAACLPEQYLEIVIEVTGETSRDFTLRAHGPTMRSAVERLAAVI